MNRQRKVVITVTYNDLGTIVDTKAEELDLSAQPERKTGKWEQESESSWKDRWSRWKCSACDKHVRISLYDDPIKAGLMFCPSCGAEMLRMEGSNG